MRLGPLFIGWRRNPPDPEEFFRDLSSYHPGRNYSKMDRYRDFRQVFLHTEQGKRVLYEIFTWGNLFRPIAPMGKFDPHETHFHDGERNLALRIMTVMNAEPRERQKDTKE